MGRIITNHRTPIYLFRLSCLPMCLAISCCCCCCCRVCFTPMFPLVHSFLFFFFGVFVFVVGLSLHLIFRNHTDCYRLKAYQNSDTWVRFAHRYINYFTGTKIWKVMAKRLLREHAKRERGERSGRTHAKRKLNSIWKWINWYDMISKDRRRRRERVGVAAKQSKRSSVQWPYI